MKIGTTLVGLENITKEESKGKIIYPGRILFSIKKNLRSALLIYDYIESFKFKDEEDIYTKVKKIKFSIKKDFKVECNREGKHKFTSQDIKIKVGEIINKKVNLFNPKTVVFLDIINDFCIIGLNPKNTGKRSYKIRINNDTLNSVIAYSLLKLSKCTKNKVLLDPFCSDGTILIEAGLLGGKKLYGFSQDIKNASINSKIAKVKINLYKENLSWFDTLFKKESVDLIISKAPYPSKRKRLEDVEKIIKELFHQASFILNKKGIILLISPKPELLEKYSKIYKFKSKEELVIKKGEEELKVLSFKKVI